MKISFSPEIQKKQADIARDEYNIQVAYIMFTILFAGSVERAWEGRFDQMTFIVFCWPLPFIQIAFAKNRIWKLSPDQLADALENLKKRNVTVYVEGDSTGDLADRIKGQCKHFKHQVKDIEWLLSDVKPDTTTVKIDIARKIAFKQFLSK